MYGQADVQMNTSTCGITQDNQELVLASNILQVYSINPKKKNEMTDNKDRLFLLNPNFMDADRQPEGQIYYCPFNAMLEGVLHYYPNLREDLEITYIDFPRPRTQIINLLGEENQGMPLMIIERKDIDLRALNVMHYEEKNFIMGSEAIATYLSLAYGIPVPH